MINCDKSIFFFLKINDISPWRYILSLYNTQYKMPIKLYMYIINLNCGLMIDVIAPYCMSDCLVIQRRSATVSTSGRSWGTSCRLLWRMLRLHDPRIQLTSWPTDCTPAGWVLSLVECSPAGPNRNDRAVSQTTSRSRILSG